MSRSLQLLLTGAFMFALGAATLIYTVSNRGQSGALIEAFEFFIGFSLITSALGLPFLQATHIASRHSLFSPPLQMR